MHLYDTCKPSPIKYQFCDTNIYSVKSSVTHHYHKCFKIIYFRCNLKQCKVKSHLSHEVNFKIVMEYGVQPGNTRETLVNGGVDTTVENNRY